MRLRNSFWSLLGRNVEEAPLKVLESVRLAMLVALDTHCPPDPSVHYLDDRINFAKDLETLWYLRSGLREAVGRTKGEAAAQEVLAHISQLFKGYAPLTEEAEYETTQPSAELSANAAPGLQWNAAFLTGDANIDEQHQDWFERLNRFLEATDKKSLMLCEMQMLQYTRVHFESEEALMFSLDYPGYAEHLKQHQKLLAALGTISRQIASDTLDLHVWRSFLSLWLTDHICGHDARFAAFLRNR